MWKSLIITIACTSLVSGLDLSGNPLGGIALKDIKTSADRIREHGYPAESHFVETSDGYVLNVFRIPYSPKLNNANVKKPVVFIQHGLFSCSDCFLLNGPENAIAYNFADAGFDVWLGNARGNIYSRANTKISLNNPKFWEFSWHEIGVVDIPTMIDYILAETGETAVHYVGHSQGTTVFFVLMSSRPEYNAKIKTAHLLAPVAFMGHADDGLVTKLGPIVGVPGVGADLLSNQQFIPYNPFLQRLLDTACGGNPTYPKYCERLFLMWGGTDQPNLNATLLPQLAETHPAGISSNQGIHYIQLYMSNEFRRYDYGVKKNVKAYGQETPPNYALDKITSSVYLYYGLADGSANPTDVARLPAYLSNLKLYHEVPNPTWGHLDFIFALTVKDMINDQVIGYCKQYET